MADRQNLAPNGPGLTPRWTSSAKSGVGTALSRGSRVWFTLSHGIMNEVYFPRVDAACIRDLGLIVTDSQGFFSEEKRHASHAVSTLAPGIPAFKLVNTCLSGRYRLTKRIITNPKYDAVLQHVKFEALGNEPAAHFRLFAILAPHLVNRGANNTAWVADYKGHPMLFAQGRGTSLAFVCNPGWVTGSAGFVGTSDGWQDLAHQGQLKVAYDRAENGNVALTAEIDTSAGEFLMALGFGTRPHEAAHRALASLQEGFEPAAKAYVAGWQQALERTHPLPEIAGKNRRDRYLTSVSVMLTHQPVSFPGAAIASLSIPWGFNKGDDDLGGYHLVWPRDLGETAGGLMAAGWGESAVAIIRYLQATQEPDGHWPQNMWLDGSVYWSGIQLDETAFPILLVGIAEREGLLQDGDLDCFLPMIRNAASYIVINGPVTGQDRWEEDPGYSPFTLAVVISALLVAARLLEMRGGDTAAAYCRDVADAWNDGIEGWTYATGTDLARDAGVAGYYVRIAPPDTSDAASPLDGFVAIKNRPPSETNFHVTEIVSPDALALVRFGLRAADDPRIVNTVKVIDHLLKVELPQGSIWKRYNGDGYGEHPDGSPFDGTGIGRAWPLLTGERAHYELAAGNRDKAEELLNAFEDSANDGGLLPEQVWDSNDLPDRELFFGKPSGSAMPLVWAHAEHVKLLRSLADGRVFDMPLEPVERYQSNKIVSRFHLWRFNHKTAVLSVGKTLRIETNEPATIHWSFYGWNNPEDTTTLDTGLGMHVADLPTVPLAAGALIVFTFFWHNQQRWEGSDFRVVVN